MKFLENIVMEIERKTKLYAIKEQNKEEEKNGH